MLILFPSYIGTTSYGSKVSIQIPGQWQYKIVKREENG